MVVQNLGGTMAQAQTQQIAITLTPLQWQTVRGCLADFASDRTQDAVTQLLAGDKKGSDATIRAAATADTVIMTIDKNI
jgi:hypothetical protein